MLRTQAFVLHRHNAHDNDRFFCFLTPDHGKMKAFAKGIRKAQSKLAAHLEPGILSELQLVRGKSGYQLIGAHNLRTFKGARDNYETLQLGQQALRLIDLVTREEGRDEVLFQLLKNLWMALDEAVELSGTAINMMGLMFQLQVLAAMGVQPMFDRCLICGHKQPSEIDVWLTGERVGIVCQTCVSQDTLAFYLTSPNRGWFKWLLTHQFTDTQDLDLPQTQQQELSFLIQSFLQYQLDKTGNFMLY